MIDMTESHDSRTEWCDTTWVGDSKQINTCCNLSPPLLFIYYFLTYLASFIPFPKHLSSFLENVSIFALRGVSFILEMQVNY